MKKINLLLIISLLAIVFFSCKNETVTKENQTIKLNFKPVTLAKLQATMKQFEALF